MKLRLFAMVLLMTAVLSDSCGGNCPSGKCQTCFCGKAIHIQDINSWCSKYSWDQGCCKCMVATLSGGNSNAMNRNPNGSYNVGLWQVNNLHWGVCNNGKAPCDPQLNLNCAILVYKQNKGTWNQWPQVAKACKC